MFVLKFIDNFLNTTTMYRVVLYYLIFLCALSFIFSFFGLIPSTPIEFLSATLFLVAISVITNGIFARVFSAPINTESAYITALILALIITPPDPHNYFAYLPFGIWAAVLAMASKFIFAIKKKHVFNPAAIAVVLTAIFINESASWWIGGNDWLTPFVVIGGVLIVRKIRRTDLVLGFFAAAMFSIAADAALRGVDIVGTLTKAIVHAPLFFFAFVMLTEPLTTPPSRLSRIAYGAFVGILSSPSFHVGSIYFTPEIALVIGNVFSYIISPKEKFLLSLKEKILIAKDTYEFVFGLEKPFAFRPGQYMEWTIGHTPSDSRGTRRSFTVASSPTENDLRIGVKFYPQPSSFKRVLFSLAEGDHVVASQLSGDFVLPKNADEKLVFLAGGIGITPFRSMAKYLSDRNERRDIVVLYSNKTEEEIAYREIFDSAQAVGMRMVYVLSQEENIRPNWEGERGFIDKNMIVKHIPDYHERTFYISGPHSMVAAFKTMLLKMGVKRSRIKTDYFPGFA